MKNSRTQIQPAIAHLVSRWDHKRVALLTGQSGIFYLAHVWQFGLIQQGFKVHNVDCAIRFDAYAIAEEALRNGVSPEDIHDRITVSRCFTPYQILDEMNYLVSENVPDRLNFILAPAKQFFDGDVGEDEGLFLLRKLAGIIREFQKKEIPLMVVEKESYSRPAFRAFYADLLQIAHPQFHLKILEKKKAKEIKKYYSVRVAGLVGGAA